ncbi:cell surface protein SprA [Pelobium manganitolerans]|uniref:Cell surface protein SprA n=1 Tax=Pelobium manganitolerans TaxID=1842495 RepID=A0A419SCH2_9SPHI|nr:cell surface protein SprA [Pelobium manganitolerans]RKD20380.1 cell surface protein SprA [Pelobium manganitolerans]
MKINFTKLFIIAGLCLTTGVVAQAQNLPADSLRLRYPVKDDYVTPFSGKSGLFLQHPQAVKKTVEYDPKTQKYIVKETLGGKLIKAPQYLTFKEYQALEEQNIINAYWKTLVSTSKAPEKEGFIPEVKVQSKAFERIFGGNTINIQPRGSADLTFSGRLNRNENPLFNERQRRQGNFDFDQRIQMNLVGNIGEKLKINTNYNTEAQFDFENQIKLEYTGDKDEIIQKIEAGIVNFPLNTTLISGSQALFGVKTQLQFGRLGVTTMFSQQKSQSKEINITNGAQQNEFRLSTDNYEANKHYFLAQYFRNNYNRALANLPIISSNINITKIEVWVTNKSNSTTDSRDVLAFMDLGENQPYNTTLFQGGAGFSALPAGFSGPGFTQQSNNLLQQIPATARQTNANDIDNYFQGNGALDNYNKLTYARKLTDREYALNPQLGYISLNNALNADEILAVAYRYSVNGVEYQVGEFSTDVQVQPENPQVLYTKLLKNETTKTNLPIWDLMMKNIYSLGAYQISPTDFKLNIFRLDDKAGIEKPLITEGENLNGKLWLQVTNLDRLNQQGAKEPDGYFDFLEGLTIDSQNGRIIFPTIEPFGKDLASQFNATTEQALVDKYVYQPLYDSTKTIAQQLYPGLNRYVIKGTYQSQVSSEFQLNAINVPEGSVVVTAGTLKLTEGADYTVDYNIGRVKILNDALLNSGQPIKIKLESNELFGIQQKSLFGTRLDYRVNDNFNVGATFMNLKETPLTQKINFGEESISNSIYGFDLNYSTNSRFLTRMVDKLPFLSTKETSSITFNGEFAKFNPGHPKALDFAGNSGGTSYLDDFEGSRSVIDLKSSQVWQISGTPQLFPESALSNDLAYGFNRAKLAFYNIDPIFYSRSSQFTPSNIRNNKTELSNHYVREVLETEVFPYKQVATGTLLSLSTLNLAYYPMLRGPYNFTTTGLNTNGTLGNPRSRWGGIFRKIETNDFEALNIEFIEFWVLDPYIYKPNSAGGDLYFNIGNISEDILKDGRKSLENGLPADGDPDKTDETVWGRVPKLQPVIQAFDNDPAARKMQDVGLDGLNSEAEQVKYQAIVNQVTSMLDPQAANRFRNDPSSDDYVYYRGNELDQLNAGILKRYENYNGSEGNSKTSQQSLDATGIENSAATSYPDGEDINRDNNSSKADEYFQYKISMRPQDLVVGKGFVTDKVSANVTLANGEKQTVNWYQIKIPIAQYQSKVGNIQDFKSIRFMRMFMTDFADTTVLRFARLQLVRGEWRRFNAENTPAKVLADPSLNNPGLDNSTLDVTTVNLDENGTRTPIPYVIPPGIPTEKDISNFRGDTRQNEQSLSVVVKNLRDGYARAAYKTTLNDVRSYKRLQMYIHTEGDQLKDGDVNAIIRIGTDYQDNYYEYEIPTKVTNPGSKDPELIWPQENRINVEFRLFQLAKTARNNDMSTGQPWPINVPYTYTDGVNTITVKGQPDLSKLRVMMLGVRNPLKTNASVNDDGLDKSAEVWFNELRLTDFDERGGWAATARVNAKLADFGDVTLAANKSTIGFGSLEQRISEINRSDDQFFDVSSSLELGKFFPDKFGLKIPMFINYSSQLSTPQYDPRNPDIELKNVLDRVSGATKDSILNYAQDFTQRRSINFTNVRKIKTDPNAKNHLWDVENWSLTYAYTEYGHRDFINKNTQQRTYRGALAYDFNNPAKFISPFNKAIKSKYLNLIKDFNFSLLPSVLNFRIELNRLYSENTLRDNDPNNFIPIRTTFNKNFQINRLYGVSWDLTKSLKLDFNATNLSVVDEPEGRITGLKRDTLWNNLKKLGRTTNYNHTISLSYTVPLQKIPGLDFVNLVTRYQTQFNWITEPLLTLNDPSIDFGNNIQNSRTIQVNPTLNMNLLYNKFGVFRRLNNAADSTGGVGKILLNALTSIKNLSGSYIRNDGTFLPGYLPKTDAFGYDFDANAPGLGFILGSQEDIRYRALANGWLTRDTLQNQLYVNSLNEKLNLRGTIEPFRDFRLELTAFKNSSKNFTTNFRYNNDTQSFESLNPITTGDYSITMIALGSAFKDKNSDKASVVFQQFMANRGVISQRLGAGNPNSSGTGADGFADGYGRASEDVVIPAFLAAYRGKDASGVSLSKTPKIPLPNWRLTYNGLVKIEAINNLFSAFDLSHGYSSTYNVNGFTSLIRYGETNGAVSVRDAQGNFLPFYQFSQVTLFEQFVPLLGIDMRMKNNMTANVEYRKSRSMSLSLANSQLASQKDQAFVIGFGYRTSDFRFPFGLFKSVNLKNDLNFKLDIALRDNKTVIYRADVDEPEISGGAKNITFRPSIDYVLNQRFNLRLFYDSNVTKPYTSQSFTTAFTNFGINLRFTIQ